MVDTSVVSTIVLNIVVMLLSVLVVGGLVIVITFVWLRWKRYTQFSCVIFEKDGFNNVNESYDKAGIFVDRKTQNKRFFMKKANVGLDPDKVPYITAGKRKTVYLIRTGLKNFRYLNFRNVANDELEFIVGEEDVNWAINAYERQKRLFNQNAFLQYLPFIALAFVSIIILVIFIYFFKDFAVLKEAGLYMKEAAIALQHAKSGTTVIP